MPVVVAVLVACFSVRSSSMLGQQTPSGGSSRPVSIWDGVYSTAQADRGKGTFQDKCAACHDDPNGDAPDLASAAFMRHWGGRSLAQLSTKINETMPADDVDGVSPAQKLDAMTYVLRMNGFPSGADELKADAAVLGRLQIVPRGGLGPLPTGALVEVVGCLDLSAASHAALTHSTEPVAATLEHTAVGEPKAVAAKALGNSTIRMQSLPKTGAKTGARVDVHGLLIRNADEVAVNVLALRVISETCP
jgi:cytochrome c5